jgi:hypothetical protein
LKKNKQVLISGINELDMRAKDLGLDVESWEQSYCLEQQLMRIYEVEELYWMQRGRVQWLKEGESNIAFFMLEPTGEDEIVPLFLWKQNMG